MDDSGQEYGGLTSRLQEIVDEAGRSLGRPVAIDDRHHRLLAYTEHPAEEVDPVRLASILRQPASSDLLEWLHKHGVRTASGPVRVPASQKLGLNARICVPIRAHTHLLGFFWLIDRDETIGADAIRQAEAAAEEAGLVLYREIMLRDLERGREREFIRDVLSEDEAVRAAAAAHLAEFDLFVSDGPVVVTVVQLLGHSNEVSHEATRVALDAAFMRVRRQLAPKHGIHLLRADHAVMLVSLADPRVRADGRLAFAERLHAELTQDLPGPDRPRLIVAIGGAADSLSEAFQSHRQALRAAEVAGTLPSFGDVVDWDSLGVYRVLAEFPPDRFGPEVIPSGLQQLLDDPDRHTLVHTVECYLDNAGEAQVTADQLFLHRTTLYHRLRRFERETRLDLNSGNDRLMLHLCLKLARLQGWRWLDSETSSGSGDRRS